jgi:hypothetical protein
MSAATRCFVMIEFLSGERCLVTQISNLTAKAIKKWTIRVGFAVWEA